MGDTESQINHNIVPKHDSLESRIPEETSDMREILKDKGMLNFAKEYLTNNLGENYLDSLIADLKDPAKKRSVYEALKHVLRLATAFAREFVSNNYEDEIFKESQIKSVVETITNPLLTRIQHAVADYERNVYGA